jgi:hypothetical protein
MRPVERRGRGDSLRGSYPVTVDSDQRLGCSYGALVDPTDLVSSSEPLSDTLSVTRGWS